MGLLRRDQLALDVNPPAGDEHLTTNGSDWLYAVTAVHVVFFLALFGLSFVARAGERIFHYLFTVANFVGAICYWAMASDLGFTVIDQVNSLNTHGATRQIFFPKYILWVVTFPTAAIGLGLLSGVSWATIAYHVFLAWIWVISYLITAYTGTQYKWGFYAFGTVAYLFLAAGTLGEGSRHARRVGIARDHTALAFFVNLIWLNYPIVFGLTDAGNRIGVVAGFIWYGIVDIFLIPLLSVGFLILARRWDYSRLNFTFTQYGRVNSAPGTFPEKEPTAAPATGGVTGGATGTTDGTTV